MHYKAVHEPTVHRTEVLKPPLHQTCSLLDHPQPSGPHWTPTELLVIFITEVRVELIISPIKEHASRASFRASLP